MTIEETIRSEYDAWKASGFTVPPSSEETHRYWEEHQRLLYDLRQEIYRFQDERKNPMTMLHEPHRLALTVMLETELTYLYHQLERLGPHERTVP